MVGATRARKTGSSLYSRIGTIHISTPCSRISRGNTRSRRKDSQPCWMSDCRRSVPSGRSCPNDGLGPRATRMARRIRRFILVRALSWSFCALRTREPARRSALKDASERGRQDRLPGQSRLEQQPRVQSGGDRHRVPEHLFVSLQEASAAGDKRRLDSLVESFLDDRQHL